jgi:tryptophan synthase alpha subunit
MRKPGGAGVQSFLAGATDFSQIGNSAQINTAKEHAQSFENNAVTAGAGISAAEQVTNAGRYAEAQSAIAGSEASATLGQAGASALGSVTSVLSQSGAFGGGSSGIGGGTEKVGHDYSFSPFSGG